MFLVVLVDFLPGGLCFSSCWSVSRLQGYVFGLVDLFVAWRAMCLVVLVDLPPGELCFWSCWFVCRLEGCVFGRVGWFAA